MNCAAISLYLFSEGFFLPFLFFFTIIDVVRGKAHIRE